MLSGAHFAHASLFSSRNEPKSRWSERRRPVCQCNSGTRLTRCLNPVCSRTATEVCHCKVKTVRPLGVLKTNCTCSCADCQGAGCGSRKKIVPIAAAAAPPPTQPQPTTTGFGVYDKKIVPIAAAAAPPPTPPQLPTTGPGPQHGMCDCVEKGSATCGGDCWWIDGHISFDKFWAMPPH